MLHTVSTVEERFLEVEGNFVYLEFCAHPDENCIYRFFIQIIMKNYVKLASSS